MGDRHPVFDTHGSLQHLAALPHEGVKKYVALSHVAIASIAAIPAATTTPFY
jgi:hypothetical protein